MIQDKEKILEKLRKLMNLKESALELGNEGEACAAAAGITRLLMAYNLSEKDIPEQERIENPVVAEEIPYKTEISNGNWYEALIATVCKYNMCRSLIIISPGRTGRMKREKFRIVGRKKNVEVVLYLVSFLANYFYQTGKKEYAMYRNECLSRYSLKPKTLVMYLRSYLVGCVLGLNKKLDSERKELQNECNITSLVVSSKAEIDEFLKDTKIEKSRASNQRIDDISAMRGYETGKNVEIRKGIYTRAGKDRLIC